MNDALRAQARSDLCTWPDGRPIDPVVWEHSQRVASLTYVVGTLPELADRVTDRTALTAAALYHDAGWIIDLLAGRLRPQDLLLRRPTDRQRDLAAEWIRERLKGILPAGTIEQAARIIRTSGERNPSLLESQILTEADNLDQVGPQAVWMLFRRQMAEGRLLIDLLDAWHRQEQYQYWPAWIKECFRFPSARAMADQRYRAMRRFMSDLEAACRLAFPQNGPQAAPRVLGRPPDPASGPPVDPAAPA